jgi:hypothetical protein
VPLGSEAAAVPTDYGFRLDHDDRTQKGREKSVQPHQDQPVEVAEPNSRRLFRLRINTC